MLTMLKRCIKNNIQGSLNIVLIYILVLSFLHFHSLLRKLSLQWLSACRGDCLVKHPGVHTVVTSHSSQIVLIEVKYHSMLFEL